MLYQKKSAKTAKFKYLLALPLILALICVSTMAFTNKAYVVVDFATKAKALEQTTEIKPAPLSEYERGGLDAEADFKSGKNRMLQPPRKHGVDTTRVNGKLVFTAVDKTPTFPGGVEGFGKFLQKNIQYPAEQKTKNIQGKVYLQFVIQPTGELTDLQVVRTPDKALGDEALRVLKMSPKWQPGMKNGKKVAVQYTVPVNFTLAANTTTTQSSNVISMKGVKPPTGSVTANTVFTAVEQSPAFPGGEDAFGKFLAAKIRYPAADKQRQIQGKVYIQFIVEKDGRLSNIKAVRSPSETMAAEALRVVRSSPKWTPGLQNGKAVRVEYTVPINFSLADVNKEGKGK